MTFKHFRIFRRVYWMDAKLHHLEFCDYDGKYRYQVLTGNSRLNHPFSLTLFEDTIYWTDWFDNSIRYTSKYPGDSVHYLHNSSSRLMDIHVVHPVKQPEGNSLRLHSPIQSTFPRVDTGVKNATSNYKIRTIEWSDKVLFM